MKRRAFILHGWAGSPDSGWKGWIRRELEKQGFAVFAPHFPDAERPQMEKWLELLGKLVGKPDEGTYLVGHSLGCILAMRYLEGLSPGEKIGGAVLVAGFSDSLGIPELKSFFPRPLDFEKMKRHCGKFVAIHSDNDRYVALRHGEIFREKLGAKLIVLHNKGHFSTSEGTIELPEALSAVLEISGCKK
jgi:predicted alpha/beta hydrolase family esterase